MDIGIGLAGDLAAIARRAVAAEAAGVESVWVPELDLSSTVAAAVAIHTTSRVRVGTALTLAFARSPTLAAMEARDLDDLSGGRFLLGLGTQVKRVMEARFSAAYERPAERLIEYAAVLRTVWAAGRGETITHEGAHYRVTMPRFHGAPRPAAADVPILFGAVGPVMARAAGSVADGLLGHQMASPTYLREVVAAARDGGAADAARTGDACPISASPLVSLGDDEDAARRAAKLQLAFYATTRNYAGILALHDRGDVFGATRRAFVRRDHEAMIAAIDDGLLDAIAIAGRPDEGRDRLAAWEPVASRVILAPPWYGVDEGEERELAGAVLDLARSVAGAVPMR